MRLLVPPKQFNGDAMASNKTPLLTLGVLATSITTAATYTTTVQIDYQGRTLSWEQKKPMQFATVVINDDSENGQSCMTYSNKKNDNRLCPGNRGKVKDADFQIKGEPSQTVIVNLDETPIQQEGLQFTPILLGDETFTLNKSGKAKYQVGGELLLLDGEAMTSTSLTFGYDLEFTSQ